VATRAFSAEATSLLNFRFGNWNLPFHFKGKLVFYVDLLLLKSYPPEKKSKYNACAVLQFIGKEDPAERELRHCNLLSTELEFECLYTFLLEPFTM